MRWRAWWSTACGRLLRSKLVGEWLVIREVDRWWGKGGLRSGWTSVCGSWVFGRRMIWVVRRRDRSLVGLAGTWLRWGVIWVLWMCSCSSSLSLCLCVCASVSPFFLCVSLEMIWSENNDRKYFPPHYSCFTVNTENIFSLTQFSGPTKQPILRKSISEISLNPNKHSLKGKSHYSFSKQFKILPNLLEML